MSHVVIRQRLNGYEAVIDSNGTQSFGHGITPDAACRDLAMTFLETFEIATNDPVLREEAGAEYTWMDYLIRLVTEQVHSGKPFDEWVVGKAFESAP